MKLATTTGDFDGYTNTPAEAVAAFAGTGFRHLDYSFYDVLTPGSPFLTEDWKREVHAAAEAAAKLGIDFVQAHSPNYNPLHPNADHEAGLLATIRSIEACGMLGIPNIVVHSGYYPTYTYPESRASYFQETRVFCEKLFPAMEKYGVSVCLENSAESNMGRCYFFMTGQEIYDFCEWVSHPLLHGCFDVGHANLRNTSIYRELVTLGKHLYTVHIQDNFGAIDEHMAPFCGTLDLDAVMQALLQVGYTGCFTFEANNLFQMPLGFHAKKAAPEVTERRLEKPSLALKQQAEALLYAAGKYILEQYGCFTD